jgi:hypothetical protein
MTDDNKHQERLRNPHLAGLAGILESKEADEDGEASCGAFGYLRGIRDQSAALEIRFKDGNSFWFPYAWMGTWRHNPGDGLLLKFSGDLVYLVLIRGSNLDKPLNEGAINLTSGGLQRHRVTWIREMAEEDIKSIGAAGPTIDSISVGQFESQKELREWLREKAPAFLHEPA